MISEDLLPRDPFKGKTFDCSSLSSLRPWLEGFSLCTNCYRTVRWAWTFTVRFESRPLCEGTSNPCWIFRPVVSQMALVWMLPKFTECYPEVVGGEHLASVKKYFRFISFHLSCLHLSTFSRKNALKTGASGDASGGGILRGDKGPKNMAPLTVKPGSSSGSSGWNLSVVQWSLMILMIWSCLDVFGVSNHLSLGEDPDVFV